MAINFNNLPDPDDRYELGNIFGIGVFGRVYSAVDKQASNKIVAIKCQKYDNGIKECIEEEYKILRDFNSHVNIVDFYGIFGKSGEIWFALEPCEGGPVTDLVQGLLARNRRMAEEHIAYILKETVKGLIFLHENNIVHRDVKGSNILLTKEGEVKLCDFGMSKKRKKPEEKMSVGIGSPCWMAPELIEVNPRTKKMRYDDRVDVWSLGITAIEIGEGKVPFQDMHPSRALFQIARNPPPTLQKLSHWTSFYHDFINECLVKEYEYRPYIMEIIEHPFLGQIPENNYHLSLEIKTLLEEIKKTNPSDRVKEINILNKLLKRSIDGNFEKMVDEDLAALHTIHENDVLELLEYRMSCKEYYTFIGDILLFLNPNERPHIFGQEYHQKYQFKSRSDNAPHIYSIADTAYQNALHHVIPQQIVLSGETGSGKTTNYLHLIDHLFYLGENTTISSERIQNAVKLIHSLIHASTPWNDYSTRAVFTTNISYGSTGKLSSALFTVNCIEKSRISSKDMTQSNFHFIYYVYDGLVSRCLHEKYKLNTDRNYRYLRISEGTSSTQPRDNMKNNVTKFKKMLSYFEELEFSEDQLSIIYSVVSAILHIGEAKFKQSEDGLAILENKETIENFSELMDIDGKKMGWALTNYCMIKEGNAVRQRNTCEEARDARDVLANTLYSRLVDYVVSIVNNKLSFGKIIFGAKYFIKILDYFGFECFKKNTFWQLLVNCFNEQMHYHFLQRVFAWEGQDSANEDIEFVHINYYKNKDTLNELLGKPEGVLSVIDDASKKGLNARYVTTNIDGEDKSKVIVYDEHNFTVAHYTGKVTYYCKDMPDKNRDFLAPEIIETMRSSQNPIISMMFNNKLDTTGNLVMPTEEVKRSRYNYVSKISRNKQYSQIKKMRTQATIFRSLGLEILKELSIGSGSGNTHFIKCIRTDLKDRPQYFQKELVRQQMRAMAIVQTARARKYGYPQRITFPEFLRRYKFLAFDYDENVDITSDNCRLLMIRLKMEGWALGKTRIFLKYYHEEYLARLYETQVKKIIKIQSILRGFLVKCRAAKEIKKEQKECITEINKGRRATLMTEDEAAEIIQKAYRKTTKRKELLGQFEELDEEGLDFIRPFAMKWKNKSIFSTLIRYRSIKLQEFFSFSQQVHLYGMNAYHNLQKIKGENGLDNVDRKATVSAWLGDLKTSVMKLSLRLDEIPFYDTSGLCDYFTHLGNVSDKEDSWDTPYRWRESHTKEDSDGDKTSNDSDGHINIDYTRDPEFPITDLPDLKEPPLPEINGYDDDDEEENSKLAKNKANEGLKEYRAPSPRIGIENKPVNSTVDKKNYINEVKSKLEQSPPLFQNIQLRKTGSPYSINKEDQENMNSSPANKDFDYIKATPVPVRPKYAADPVAELKNLAKKDSNASEDDPPYNFKGMLRKTYHRTDSRESLKNALQAVRRFSVSMNDFSEGDKSKIVTNGCYNDEPIYTKQISLEILPGLIIEGLEVEL